MPGRKSYSGGIGSVHTRSARPPRASTIAGDRERRAERVGVGVLVADGQHAPGAAQALDDDLRDGRRGTGRDRRSSAVRPWRRAGPPVRSAPAASRPGSGGTRGRRRLDPAGRRRAAAAATGVGSDSPTGASGSGVAPASSSCSSWRTRVPRSAVSSSWTWRSGMRLIRSRAAELVAHERHRPPSAATVASRSAGWPMTLTQTLAWRRSGVVSTVGDRGEPDPRIGHVPRRRSPDLLPQQLVDPLGSLAHLVLAAGRPGCQPAAIAATVCEVKHSMTSPSSRSWKLARPMPHS